MQNFDKWLALITVCIPLLVQLVTVIPSIVSNRKKTEANIKDMESKLSKEINSTKAEIESVQKDFNNHVDEYQDSKAKQARYRIIRFYDEVCDNVDHSESHWEDILDEIDFYETYCETHKDFKNNRGGIAMEYLKETYKRIKAKGAFLTHKEE